MNWFALGIRYIDEDKRKDGHYGLYIMKATQEHSLCDHGKRGSSGEGVRRRMLERREMQEYKKNKIWLDYAKVPVGGVVSAIQRDNSIGKLVQFSWPLLPAVNGIRP